MKNGGTTAFTAAQYGRVEVLKLLIEAKKKSGEFRVNLNKARKDGVTAVNMAAQNGYLDVLRLFIEAQNGDGSPRVDLNKSDEIDNFSPIAIAATNGHVGAVKLLIEAKDNYGNYRVDLNNSLKNGATPVGLAAQNGHKEIVIELLKRDVDIHLAFKISVKDLKELAQKNKPRVRQRINEFIKNKLDADEVAIEPRDMAWIMGHDDIVSLLDKVDQMDSEPSSSVKPYTSDSAYTHFSLKRKAHPTPDTRGPSQRLCLMS
jgi:ankyrin repeat protein